MSTGIGFAKFVHELSHILDPRWWDEFLRLTAEQGVLHSHPGQGGICYACMAGDPDWYTNGFPYQLGHRES